MAAKIQTVDMENVPNDIQQTVFLQAIRDFGGVYLLNHGISPQLIDDAFAVSRQFFELKCDRKIKFQKKCNREMSFNFQTAYHGYTRPAIWRSTEFREAFDICGSQRFYPNEEVLGFGNAFENLEIELIRLAKCVARMLAYCLGSDEGYILRMTRNLTDKSVPGLTSLRSLYYPALTSEEIIPEVNTRCKAHKDLGMFTLLLQDNIGGLKHNLISCKLRVNTTDGSWLPVFPLPGAVLLIMGNLWEEITTFPALVHRVDFPEDESQQRLARQSLTYFVHPDSNVALLKLDNNGNQKKVTVEQITMDKAHREGHRWKQRRREVQNLAASCIVSCLLLRRCCPPIKTTLPCLDPSCLNSWWLTFLPQPTVQVRSTGIPTLGSVHAANLQSYATHCCCRTQHTHSTRGRDRIGCDL